MTPVQCPGCLLQPIPLMPSQPFSISISCAHFTLQVTPRGFQRFLVDSPLEPVEQADCPPEQCPPSGLGSFHQQYWIDGG